MSTPTGFDELIHPSTRLSVVALLAATEWADFPFIRDSLSLSDSALSKQLHTLEEAQYLEIQKEGGGRKRRTKVRLTDRGRTAFEGHVAALRAIVDGAAKGPPPGGATPSPEDATSRTRSSGTGPESNQPMRTEVHR
ncbi:transcriptional regulator [Streptomyces chrestomyceticus JCM 4735]|uniref:Transcriptional regulator n=1 Tax=Streptomyces chrestomyceticus JCM 4735 TaxID=1306181 RepID=A0A7U9KRF1_9ACTN|nr:transcriptional regulator [Streptomyces chrestomyceticus]GCD32631.1 transcriptional regulator [Streptomyces chrestomyceticus JCM 4735]